MSCRKRKDVTAGDRLKVFHAVYLRLRWTVERLKRHVKQNISEGKEGRLQRVIQHAHRITKAQCTDNPTNIIYGLVAIS